MTRPPLPAERRRRPNRAPDGREVETFLEALSSGWSVAHSARQAGVGRQRFYEARKNDPELARRWDEAIEAGCDVLEDALRVAASEGWDEETYDGEGALVRRTRRRDPRLNERLLERRRPRYKEQTRVDVGVHVTGQLVPARRLSLQDVLDLARELEREQGRPLPGCDALELPAEEVPGS